MKPSPTIIIGPPACHIRTWGQKSDIGRGLRDGKADGAEAGGQGAGTGLERGRRDIEDEVEQFPIQDDHCQNAGVAGALSRTVYPSHFASSSLQPVLDPDPCLCTKRGTVSVPPIRAGAAASVAAGRPRPWPAAAAAARGASAAHRGRRRRRRGSPAHQNHRWK